MALAGTLKDFSLADIFQLIGLQKKTGVLTLKDHQEEARILFMTGLVVGADTNKHHLEDRLGHVLVKSNRISETELKQALASQENTLQRLGQVLVQKGFIKPEHLRESLRIQTTQIIFRLFRWIDGEYNFQQERYVDYDQENFEPISSESILMEGVRMLDEWPLIEKKIPNFEVILERTTKGQSIKLNVDEHFTVEDTGPEDSFNSIVEGMLSEATIDEPESKSANKLSHEQEQVLKLVTKPTIVQELVDSSGMNEFETCRSLYDLINMGLLQRVTEESQESVVVEKEHNLPMWVPVSLVSIIAVLSYLFAWNPANHYFPSPNDITRQKQGFSRNINYRFDQINQAIDLYFVQTNSLPPDLEHLVSRGLLRPNDIEDALGRPISYTAKPTEGRFVLSAEGRNEAGEALTQNGRKITRKKVYLRDTPNSF